MVEAAGLLPIAESIADGVAVDWNAVESGASAPDLAIVRELRILEELANLHRTTPALSDLSQTAVHMRRGAAAPAIGRWAHLDLIERLGGGAYGEVYRAWDRHLEREVALKLLRPDAELADPTSSRIVSEARLLARVRHTNVVTVYGVAEHDRRVGLWMELVSGVTLEQVLMTHGAYGAGEAALVGIDLCRALAAIHEAGLIHRDIKTQNVMREKGGRVVLMDLGTGRDLNDHALSGGSDLAGTPLYFAPELFDGRPATAQTDLYSLGVLLYRLVTAAFPVRAATLEELRAAHAEGTIVRLRDARPDLPTDFVRIVDRATSRNPGQRYSSAGELEADLLHVGGDRVPAIVVAQGGDGTQRPRRSRWLGGIAATAAIAAAVFAVREVPLPWRGAATFDPHSIRSIAVLPLTNLSGDQGQDYIADGMTEALIDSLARLHQLRVISRTSVMQFKGTRPSLADVARRLNVDAVLEGSVVKSEGRVRISANLVHVATDRHVWVQTYDRDLGDVLAIQSEVARAIAREVQIQVTPVEQAGFGVVQTVNSAAEDAYLRGRYYWNKRTDDGYQRALDYFREAVALDPSFARAYAGQADVYNLLPGRLAPSTAYPLAKDAANRALQFDPTLAEAHTSLAFASFIYDHDWSAAEAGFKRAIQFNPGYATAHQWYGDFLTAMGRFDEAVAQVKEALALDPLSPTIRTSLADSFYMAKRYDEAITEYRAIFAANTGETSGYVNLTLSLANKHLLDDARQVVDQWAASLGPSPQQRALGATIQAMSGDRAQAIAVANELAARGRDNDALADMIAWTFIYVQDYDRAFELLTQAAQGGAPGLVWAKVDPVLDPIRNDPRFGELRRKLRLGPP